VLYQRAVFVFLFILVAIFTLAGLVCTCVFTFMDILTLLSHLLGYAKLVYTTFPNQSIDGILYLLWIDSFAF
jgi:hypothetical protein